MNFARVICDRRAAQSIMRNIAFALQARNQRARIRRLNVRRYRRRLALNVTRKMFCAGFAEGTETPESAGGGASDVEPRPEAAAASPSAGADDTEPQRRSIHRKVSNCRP